MAYQIDKQRRRDKKRKKDRYGMTEDGRSVKYLQRLQRERAEAIKRKRQRERKEEYADG